MDTKKQILVNSVISFLKGELNGDTLDEEKKESLEVAIQCLETAFQVDDSNQDKVDLLSLITVKSKSDVTEADKAQAEEHKTKGNNFMKNSEYNEAVDEYTKAIELDPYNAVYYCNRAAAYTRLSRDLDVIADCNEAIRLNPSYGKAYGRLGIAYTNLNKYELAIQAYQTALKFEPANTPSYNMYDTNLKLAQQKLHSSAEVPEHRGFSGNPLEDPNVVNLATQILSDANFHNMMSGIINNMPANGGEGIPAAMQSMLQAGHAAVQRVRNENPDLLNHVARNVWMASQPRQDSENTVTSNQNSNEEPSDKKDQGST